MSEDAQVGAIRTVFHCNMVSVIERWERHITAAGSDIADVTDEELAQFRGQVSNPDNVQQFLERWEGEEGDVEKGLGDGRVGEGEDDDSDNLEIVISDDDDDEDDKDNDDEMAGFIVDNAEEDEENY